MNEKQQQLLFDKGITNVPSDALCSDNALAESIGLVYADGEHKVIQKPVKQMGYFVGYTTHKILYIHKYNGEKRYIAWKRAGHYSVEYSLVWCENEDRILTLGGTFSDVSVSEGSDGLSVSSIGKTLIVSDVNGLHYYLWNTETHSYNALGDIPDLKLSFYLRLESNNRNNRVSNSLSYDGILTDLGANVKVVEKKQEDYNNLAIGLYSKNKLSIARKKGFCEPFFVRAALELYDGTYTFISQPVLMFPAITKNTYFQASGNKEFVAFTHYWQLYCNQQTDYTKFSDIIKDVVLFVSDGVPIYDLTIDQTPVYYPNNPNVGGLQPLVADAIGYDEQYSRQNFYIPTRLSVVYDGLSHRSEQEIIDDITSNSVFYKLCSLGRKSIMHVNTASKIHTYTLENLTTQEQLEYDDYYSRCTLNPSFIYSYNSRLNIANTTRGFFNGYSTFLPYYTYNINHEKVNSDYEFYVTIKTDNGSVTVKKTANTAEKQGLYFYYPDSRATRVVIKKNNTWIFDQDLKEHPGLNGAYYFGGLPTQNYSDDNTITFSAARPEPVVTEDPKEMLANYIIQSEVNNPLVFKAEGYFRVGTGKIMAMSSTTQALSEGQFGQFPLLVFSESGVWALTVADTGYYNSIHPISREVCNNPKSVTQTDGAVFFVSKKGLMVIVGSQVKCVSEQLSGKTKTNALLTDEISFNEFLQDAFIAYDYRDSLLWIFNTTVITSYQQPYIYSIKSGTFGRVTDDLFDTFLVTNAVNDYPDYLLSAGVFFYSLMDRPDINADGTMVNNAFVPNTYSASLFTRPLKLENALALKSILQVKHITDFTPYSVTNNGVTTTQQGSLTLRIFASNNLKDWFEVTSLHGTPWKYYRFRYDFANLRATDRFAGTMLITQERRTNKLR